MSTATMHTAGGRFFDLLNPRPEDVCLSDIAVHLGRVCRFNGAVNVSVAQHSVEVMREAVAAQPDFIVNPLRDHEFYRPRFALYALLHDAHEAYIGDITTPQRAALEAFGLVPAAISTWKEDVQRAIHTAFGLDPGVPPSWARLIHTADQRCLVKDALGAGLSVKAPEYAPEYCKIAAGLGGDIHCRKDCGTWSSYAAGRTFEEEARRLYAEIAAAALPPALR